MATIASIQNLLSKEDCEKILRRSLNFQTQLVSYNITKSHEEAAGFLGDHLSLTITFISNNIQSQVNYFLKTLPQSNLNQLEYVTEAGIFKKEAILYQNLLNELIKFSHFGPRCFFVKDNLIVLEDLVAKGFKMNDRLQYISEDHCVGMLKTLAKFHASTIVYEKERGLKLNEKFTEEIKQNWFSFTEEQPMRHKWLKNATKCVIDLMRLVPVDGCNIDEVCEKFEKFVSEELESCLYPSKKFRNLLVHDDLWCNNMLFNDKDECIFVDFQLCRYAPPGMDFLMSLHLNLESSQVEKSFSTFVNVYYTFFVEELKNRKLDSSEFPRRQFEESLEWYKLAALTVVAFFGTHVFISRELCSRVVDNWDSYSEFSFINRSKYAVKEFRENSQYRARLSRILTLLAKTLANKN